MGEEPKVVVFPGTQNVTLPAGSQPQKEIVAALEALFADALVGVLQAVVFAAVDDEGAVRTLYSLPSTSKTSFAELIGALDVLKHRILVDEHENSEPVGFEDEGDA